MNIRTTVAEKPPQKRAAPETFEEDDGVPGEGPLWQRLAGLRLGEGPHRRVLGWVILTLAVALGAFQIYITVSYAMDARQQRLAHLVLVLALGFLIVPASKKPWGRSAAMVVVDCAFILASIAVCLYPILFQAQLARRAGAYETLDWVMGLVLCAVLLEVTRRTVGWFMSVLVLLFMFYAWAGPWFPGVFRHRGATIERLSTHVYLGTDGILGFTLGVVVTFVFIFILFGAMLQKSGGGNFFIGLAFALTGKSRGGPAKGAVLGSALMGSVSGSAIGNVATTGPFTIPMMKKVGYKSHDAAGIEAAASTGGQVLPPIMGAGAFLIAERTGIPYADIVKVSIIPALMYFASVYIFVSLLARKHNIGGMKADQLPKVRDVMRSGWHFLAPLVLLVTLLLNYVPPARAGMYALLALFVVSMLRVGSRMSLKDLGEVFVIAAKNTIPVSAACAIAGVIVGVVGMTGLGLVISELLITAFAGNLLLTLIMVALASLILGVGLPVTASYVVIIILAGPALEGLGLALIVTHLIVYWLSQDSNVTPPVALAAFVGAGIAAAPPMRSALSAWKFAKGLYLIPLLMAYSALMLQGSWIEVAIATITGMVALFAASVGLEGYMLSRVRWYWRVALGFAAAFVLIAPEWSGWIGNALDPAVFVWGGTLISLAIMGLLWLQRDRGDGRSLPNPVSAAITLPA
ncbi:TRAP transporter 4TM/12TM fusion protein [Mycolicibacterium mucogenicum 261Sha1.1M5]|nr:TRAP transporter 4TM/12TM fusion protein [Mycolicibacterium mucogenicum 261Sha1.1M5]